MSYNPYEYYHQATQPCTVTRRLVRSASISSTLSVCSDDSTFNNPDDDDEYKFDEIHKSNSPVASPIDIDDDDDDDDDEEDDYLRSPYSPTESTSSRLSWSSASSSSSKTSRQSSYGRRSPVPAHSRSDMPKPRGPRPLPTLPISQPSSPISNARNSLLPVVLPLKVTPPLRLNTKICPPPPSYEEAISAVQPQVQPEEPVFVIEEMEDDAAVEYMTSPLEDTIDWDSIEAFIVCDG